MLAPLAGDHTARSEQPAHAPIGVFLCDDVAGFRALLRTVLEADPRLNVIGEASDARECVRAVERSRPDVVLLDLSMPGRGGLWAIPRIRARAPDCSIIVLSALSEERMAARVRAAGAQAYIEKGAALTSIIDAVHDAVG